MSKELKQELENEETEREFIDVPEEESWSDEAPEEPAEKVGFFKKMKNKAVAFGDKHPKGVKVAKTVVGGIALLGIGLIGGIALSERKKLTGESEELPENCTPLIPMDNDEDIPELTFEEVEEPEAQIEESVEEG